VGVLTQAAVVTIYLGKAGLSNTEPASNETTRDSFPTRGHHYVPPGLKLKNSTFCPHSVFMCFVWISEQTAIISLYSINWLVFITETGCVYCAVRTGSLNIIQFNLRL
jgi:hypothetical protein